MNDIKFRYFLCLVTLALAGYLLLSLSLFDFSLFSGHVRAVMGYASFGIFVFCLLAIWIGVGFRRVIQYRYSLPLCLSVLGCLIVSFVFIKSYIPFNTQHADNSSDGTGVESSLSEAGMETQGAVTLDDLNDFSATKEEEKGSEKKRGQNP